MVRHDISGESMEAEDVIYQKVSGFRGCGELGESHKVYGFRESVNNSQSSVTLKQWQTSDKIQRKICDQGRGCTHNGFQRDAWVWCSE